MTEHLSECYVHEVERRAENYCICDALRECKERVLEAAVHRVEALPWSFIAEDGHRSVNAFGCLDIIAEIRGDQQ